MPKKITVSLGGKSYEISQVPFKASREWRKRFAEPIETIVGSLEYTGELITADWKSLDLGNVVRNVGGMILGGVGSTLIGSMDTMAEMLFAYAPELEAHRAEIEEHAYDDELMHAFVEVLKLAYPFSEILTAMRGPR